MRIGVFSGKYCAFFNPESDRLDNTDREDVKRRFLRGEIDVLLCTDAAAEGLNLQTADLLVNFDLPWNPMKVEQRIGRIDRIGQSHDEIYVLNLCVLGSVEEVIYGRLLKRLGEARRMVGSLPFSLLPLYEEEFSKYACGELDEDALLTIASERIEKQKSSISGMEMAAEDQYDFYRRLFEENRAEEHPVSLEQIWETLFQASFENSGLQACGRNRE
jgi:superfamily II DNA/RNA helicase